MDVSSRMGWRAWLAHFWGDRDFHDRCWHHTGFVSRVTLWRWVLYATEWHCRVCEPHLGHETLTFDGPLTGELDDVTYRSRP
jgi:hypothetical protein